MAESTVWWLIAGAAVAVELLTGTFYLLMLAIGLVAAALAAHAGAPLTGQLVVAALMGGGAVAAWYRIKQKTAPAERANANPDVNLDIGETVQVESWRSDGTASVKHRGAQWTAVPAAGTPPAPGPHRIVAVRGSQLVIEKRDP